MQVAAVQCPVQMNVSANLENLQTAVADLVPETLVVAPEGLLSGYRPKPGFVGQLNEAATVKAIAQARELAIQRRLHLIAGACIRIDGVWRNSSFYFGAQGQLHRYDKVNLATTERGDFAPGGTLPVFDIQAEGQSFRLGIQMCREIRYPEQWRWLAMQGAQVIAYVNNAVGSTEGHEVWRAHVISRAAETQRFVVGANNAADDQTCSTLIVTPAGRVIAEAPIGQTATVTGNIDLSTVSDWVVSQARSDVVAVIAR